MSRGLISSVWSAKYSTRSQKNFKYKKKLKRQCPLSSVQVMIREGSPQGTRKTMEERICERDEFSVWSERPM